MRAWRHERRWRGSVEKTVDKVLRETEDQSFEPVLRATLKLLMAQR